MARPRKTGLDYFPFDVDFFEDEKLVCIAGEFGIKGEIAAVKLLCAVYRNGYFIEWSDTLRMKILRQMPGVSAELFDQILNRLVRWGFFDASLFDSVKVLTSVGIQRRYFEITKRCLKPDEMPYLLVSATLTRVNVTKTRVNVAETPQIKENKTKKGSTCVDPQKQGVIPGLLNLKTPRPKKIAENNPSGPAFDEVRSYFLSQDADKRLANWEESARRFYDNFTAVDWRDKFNRRIARWDSRANNWILDEEIRQADKKNETNQTDRFSERRGTEPSTKNRKAFKGTL